MKKIFLLLILSGIAALSASAADDLRALAKKIASSRVSFSYVYETARDGFVMKGGGNAVVQGDAFRMEGNGLEIVSDGTTRWTADAEARELFIEPVDRSAVDFVSNPARLLANIDAAFTPVDAGESKFRGRVVQCYILSPADEGTGIRKLRLYFSNRTLVGAAFILKDGSETEFMISDMVFDAPGPASDFRFDEKKTDSGWVVTDLR